MSDINPYQAPESSLSPEREPRTGNQADLTYYNAARFKKLYDRSRNVNCLAFLAGAAAICVVLVDDIEGYAFINLLLFLFSTATCIGLIQRTVWGRFCGIIGFVLVLLVSCYAIVGGLPTGLYFAIIALVGLFALFGAKELFGENRLTHRLLKKELKMRRRHRRL